MEEYCPAYFQACTTGVHPVMAPADYRISLLSAHPMHWGAANRGIFTLRYNCGRETITTTIGLCKRLTNSSVMLRAVAVRIKNLDNEYDEDGIIMEGCPMMGGMGVSDRNIKGFFKNVVETRIGPLDKCFRMLAGLFNSLRGLGILDGGGSVLTKRLAGFLGSTIMRPSMGTFLEDPLMGFEKLMDLIANLDKNEPLVYPLDTVHLDKYYQGNEATAARFLSNVVSNEKSRGAWIVYAPTEEKNTPQALDPIMGKVVKGHVGYFYIDVPDGPPITLDSMSTIKELGTLISRGRKNYRWAALLEGLTKSKDFPGTLVAIPVGADTGQVYFIPPPFDVGGPQTDVDGEEEYGESLTPVSDSWADSPAELCALKIAET